MNETFQLVLLAIMKFGHKEKNGSGKRGIYKKKIESRKKLQINITIFINIFFHFS